jgi:hypothetical protein
MHIQDLLQGIEILLLLFFLNPSIAIAMGFSTRGMVHSGWGWRKGGGGPNTKH